MGVWFMLFCFGVFTCDWLLFVCCVTFVLRVCLFDHLVRLLFCCFVCDFLLCVCWLLVVDLVWVG